ncbi:MAG: hypothetical protein V1922_01745 [bacterium]
MNKVTDNEQVKKEEKVPIAKSKQDPPENINDINNHLGNIFIFAILGAFLFWKLLQRGFIGAFIGASLGGFVGSIFQLIVHAVKRRRYIKESAEIQLNEETLPLTIPIKRARALWMEKWTLVIREDSLDFQPDKHDNKKKICRVSRTDARDVMRIERQFMGRSVFVDSDGKTLLFIVNKYCEDRIRWWIGHDWGISTRA